MQETDLYQALGVARNANDGDIKRAYRSAARKYHPDVNPSDDAKEKFQTINEAYQVLSNPEMRQRYDQFGMAGIKGAAGAPNMQDFDLGDIFESFFGGSPGGGGGRARQNRPTQGDDLRFDLELDFKTALFGGEKKIRITQLEACATCAGSGVAPGASVTTCTTCGGRGVVMQTVNTILGRMQQQSRCPTCGGSGSVVEKYCGSCDGRGTNKRSKQLTVTIPPGVENGNRLRVRGEGDAGPKGGPSGDLYVFLSVSPSNGFRREGMDIFSEARRPAAAPPPPLSCRRRLWLCAVSVSYLDAILGSTLKIDTVDGSPVDVALPAGTQPGATLRLEGKGAPKLNNLNVRGSHFIKVNVQIPKSLSTKEKELVTKLRAESR
ncbi:putative DNAJ [Emiliania huxleyi CCMP1516]|uniref:Uncharacterized protein n=2 Tax=Emiliania huxleyi TaxID=2903 RepID=A0A0D3JXT0_EMIH1|nr:putative DNAJ [Emiliania huxleyi CCMP1516]EOD28315.1 putative DNAJ [Emiliania huxleyi CCMP1516]|eukprot:XP_005780744.1 putative DNAJ [Emiliania huxleyi CCMP1516]